MKIILLNFIIILVLYSCFQKKTEEIKEEEKPSLVVGDTHNISKDKASFIDEKLSLLDKDINVQNIKSQLDDVTTSFLSRESSKIFIDRKKNNFYGYYTLIKNDAGGYPSNIIGKLVIYDSINPYRYEKNTDEFVEITLLDKGVSVYDKRLEVGITYNNLIKELGVEYDLHGNTLVFASKDKLAFFKTKDSIVSKIKIGIYRDDVDINRVLKNSNW